MIKVNKEDYSKYYIQGSDHYLIPKDELVCLLKEIKELQSQLSYLRSGEYLNQLRFERDMLQQENQELKKQLEECQLQNFNLREDIIIKKMSFPSKEIKDKSFLELYDMPSYEDLKKENQQLKKQLQQKENIINKTKDVIEKMLTIGYSKGLTYYYPAKNGEFGIRAKVLLEILDNKGE